MLIFSAAPNVWASYEVQVSSAASRYGLDACLVQAILSVESNGVLQAHNKRTHDYGLMQLNERTIKAYAWDKQRLLVDAAYNIEAGTRVLHDIRRDYGKREPYTWMCRYNVGYGRLSGARLVRCARYLQLVQAQVKLCTAPTKSTKV